MMLKIGNEYLDMDEQPEVERQSLLFEDVANVRGDFSYSFVLPTTSKNVSLLGLESINKRLNNNIDCSLVDEQGVSVYVGFIRVDSKDDNAINASFYSGNSNWMDILNVPLRNSFDFSRFDIDIFTANIASTFGNDSGIVFPVVDRGAMATRSTNAMFEEDFQPFIFVKDIVKIITQQSGIKISGDFNTDPVYQKLITANNSLSGLEERIANRTSYIGTSATQTIPLTTWTTVEFDNDTAPYSNSPNGNWNTTTFRYTADLDYKVITVNVNLKFDDNFFSKYRILKNGVNEVYLSGWENLKKAFTKSIDLTTIADGDYFEFQLYRNVFPFGIGSGQDVLQGSSITVKPVKFYKAFADSLLPDITASEFLRQIFQLKNLIPTYDPFTKTIDTVLFNRIKNNSELDLSQYINGNPEEDYTDFVSEYGRRNLMKYTDQEYGPVEEYNKINAIPYGGGSLDVDDSAINGDNDLFQLDFVAAWQNYNAAIGSSLAYLGMVEAVEDDDAEKSITSVTDNGDGYARFNFSGSNPFTVHSLVRIKEMTNDSYNGDFRIIANAASYIILQDIAFDTDATGTIVQINIEDVNNEEQALLIYQASLEPLDFSGATEIWFNSVYTTPSFSFAYFWLPFMDLPVNDLKEALYFDEVNDPAAYQIGLSESYSGVEAVLNDPVKVTPFLSVPETVYRAMDQRTPIRIKTSKFNSLFYLNKTTGYKNPGEEFSIELIKLP